MRDLFGIIGVMAIAVICTVLIMATCRPPPMPPKQHEFVESPSGMVVPKDLYKSSLHCDQLGRVGGPRDPKRFATPIQPEIWRCRDSKTDVCFYVGEMGSHGVAFLKFDCEMERR